jgi:hypothetical protein
VPLLDHGVLTQGLIALATIGVLALVLRWTFGRSSSGLPDDGDEDYGLLAPVAVTESAAEAEHLRAVLAAADIRATVARARGGRHLVLVFTAELDRARRVGGWST